MSENFDGEFDIVALPAGLTAPKVLLNVATASGPVFADRTQQLRLSGDMRPAEAAVATDGDDDGRVVLILAKPVGHSIPCVPNCQYSWYCESATDFVTSTTSSNPKTFKTTVCAQ